MTKTQMGIAMASLALAGTVTYTKLSSPSPKQLEERYQKLIQACLKLNQGRNEKECQTNLERNPALAATLAKAIGDK